MIVNNKTYEKKFDAQLEKWNTKINLLKASADKAKAAANITYYETIEAFHAAAWKFK
jgi:hypothetical protein